MDDFSAFWHFAIFQVLPYVVIVAFLGGSFVRWLVAPYSWKSQSSKIMGGRQTGPGFNLFHIGVLLLFFGHFFGLFTPEPLLNAVGLKPAIHQMAEIAIGGMACIMALVGMAFIIYRRMTNPRVQASTRPTDWLVLILILAVLCLGAACVINAFRTDRSGHELIAFGNWAKGIVTLNPEAWTYLVDAPIWNKMHIFVGLMIFLSVPFTRLVHIWSGFMSPFYLLRRRQLMRMNDSPMGPSVYLSLKKRQEQQKSAARDGEA